MTGHKHAAVLRAIADGKEVEYKMVEWSFWHASTVDVNPIRCPYLDWRIKPEEQKEPMPTPHPHAASMLLYAQDLAIDKDAWKNWEHLGRGSVRWSALAANPHWDKDCGYRRKPELIKTIKTIKVTTNSGRVLEFPEPLRVAPACTALYYYVGTHINVMVANWAGDNNDVSRLRSGICHLALEAAEQHAAALLAVNRGE